MDSKTDVDPLACNRLFYCSSSEPVAAECKQVPHRQRRRREALLVDAARTLRATERGVSFRLRPLPVPASTGFRWADVRVGPVELRQPAVRFDHAPRAERQEAEEEGADRMDAEGDRGTGQGEAVRCGLSGGQVGVDDAEGHERGSGAEPGRRAMVCD